MGEAAEKSFCVMECLIRIFRQQKNMTHFSSWHGLVFSVEVKADLVMSEEAIPPGRSVPPQVSEEIHHHDGMHEGGIT